MSKVENINPEKEPIPRSWVPTVITGGKDDEPPGNNWLETLDVGTVFVCMYVTFTFGDKYELVWKGNHFYLLQQEMGDGTFRDTYVEPNRFCHERRKYEVLGINPPDRGGNNEQRDPY